MPYKRYVTCHCEGTKCPKQSLRLLRRGVYTDTPRNDTKSDFFRGLFLITAIFLSFLQKPLFSQDRLSIDTIRQINKGVWVTCFSGKKVLYSKEAVLGLVEFCKKEGITEIYLQLYRGDQAYYNTNILDRTSYEKILDSAGVDTISFLLNEAGKNNIKVFAWVNVLSISKNREAKILSKFGKSILTKDQYLRPSIRDEGVNETDIYYLRDDQLFLEPGDPRAGEYILTIIDEILTKYPLISGVHLDYIRYPYAIPYLPKFGFHKYGLSYGYGEKNIENFKNETGLNPLNMKDEEDNFLQWDNWKRAQVTGLVERIYKSVKARSNDLLVSCAVMPSPEIAYTVAFQDWPLWLDKGIVDYVVIMDYTRDTLLAKERLRSSLSHRGKGKVFVGIGTFLMKDEPDLFLKQYRTLLDLDPDGIVFFSYDDMLSIQK